MLVLVVQVDFSGSSVRYTPRSVHYTTCSSATYAVILKARSGQVRSALVRSWSMDGWMGRRGHGQEERPLLMSLV